MLITTPHPSPFAQATFIKVVMTETNASDRIVFMKMLSHRLMHLHCRYSARSPPLQYCERNQKKKIHINVSRSSKFLLTKTAYFVMVQQEFPE